MGVAFLSDNATRPVERAPENFLRIRNGRNATTYEPGLPLVTQRLSDVSRVTHFRRSLGCLFSNKHFVFVVLLLLWLRPIKVAPCLCLKVKRKAKELLPELLSSVPSLANCEDDKRIGESAVKGQSPG